MAARDQWAIRRSAASASAATPSVSSYTGSRCPLRTAAAPSTAPTPTLTASGTARLRRTAPFAVANRTIVATSSAIAKPSVQPVPGRTAPSTEAT